MRAAERISHLLSQIPYEDLTPQAAEAAAAREGKYVRPPITEQNFVPEIYR